eukprot:1152633-Pelagomonas_calceolata.AAC.3
MPMCREKVASAGPWKGGSLHSYVCYENSIAEQMIPGLVACTECRVRRICADGMHRVAAGCAQSVGCLGWWPAQGLGHAELHPCMCCMCERVCLSKEVFFSGDTICAQLSLSGAAAYVLQPIVAVMKSDDDDNGEACRQGASLLTPLFSRWSLHPSDYGLRRGWFYFMSILCLPRREDCHTEESTTLVQKRNHEPPQKSWHT